ncbi:LamG domain-containing protein [Pontiellaceae bacterium B1224]|nr:LamG domain-containing protein [Pontiellaceae bacterium B1224]
MKKTGLAFVFLLSLSSAGFAQTAVIRTTYENILMPLASSNRVVGVAGAVSGNTLYAGNTNLYFSANNQARLATVQLGAPSGAIVANYGLGDELTPPVGAAPGSTPIFTAANILWLDYADKLLAIDSGAAIVQWLMDDGTTNTVTYAISPNAKKRPVRLYWTDDENGKPLQNAGPTVQFGQNYQVDLFQSTSISINEADYQWSYSGPGNSPDYDVWLDGSMLHAKKGATGKFLLTYSNLDGFGFRQYLGHEVVEVLAPMSNLQNVHVGDRLIPVQRSYEIEDLFSTISRGATDPTGENPDDIFVYKHNQGVKNGWVWATRETMAPWQVEIYWKAKETLDVIWPFEVDIYDITWGDELQHYVRGELDEGDFEPSVYLPSELAALVMPYQTKDGEQGASEPFAFVEDGVLHTDALGKFLLRYSTEDHVWFEPVEAVSYDRSRPVAIEQTIATELRPADLSGNYTNWPGYCYTPSGTAFNPNYYAYPEQYQTTDEISSSIYGVNKGSLEVWWANASKFWQLEGTDEDEVKLPNPVFFPSMVNVYTNVWPTNADQIVTASGLGTSGWTAETNHAAVLQVNGSGFSVTNQSDLGSWSIGSEFTLEAWIRPDSLADGAVMQKGTAWSLEWIDGKLAFNDGVEILQANTSMQSNEWQHLALTYTSSGTVKLFLNGAVVGLGQRTNSLVSSASLTLGAFAGQLDEVAIWNTARSPEEIQDSMRFPQLGQLQPTLVYFSSFNADEENGDYDPNQRTSGGLPNVRSTLSLAGASPEIYVQNNDAAQGYNPNEEHALIIQDTVYALRSDLNQTNDADYSSAPFVLVEYETPEGTPTMAIYEVVLANELYAFEQFLEAGQMLQAPAPLNQLQPDWSPNNGFSAGALVPFEDRTGRYWAHQANDDGMSTNAVASLWYPNQTGFWYPDGASPPAGEPVALLGAPNDQFVDFNYTISWPDNVPGLYVGDTLTTPKDNLPAIRGQLSVGVVYQQSLTNSSNPSVKLIDPTRARKAEMVEPPGGMKSYRDPKTGNTFFSELPPALRARMFWNGTEPESSRFQLIGEFVERTDGHNYLMLNTLSQSNRVNALDMEIVTGQDDVWISSVGDLPATVFEVPNDDIPVDSLALSTVGKGQGYVTLIFNDSTNTDMVDPSENVDMVVIQVVPELYRGKLDPIFSPNPLDKQMTLKYTADFAGEPELFAFEWEYADPDNGSAPPEDSANWKFFAASDGLHYTTIGGAGIFGLSDHYLRCRYRALDPDVQANVGTNWAAWTPPQLSEGWIKRALKEINPFEQRIRDYMNYEVDTSLSMVQQAGRPYNGDIPLNYGALDDYGLIPIYETIYRQSLDLTKEGDVSGALSLALMLVSGRLSDFYTLLGNEAYADALNPTVTLGSDDPVAATEISSIFCFQNQLPDLLSEELVLLRGRDSTMNPNVADYPIYNRLPWNFTADITGGEVAYALNYGISDLKGNQNGSVDEGDAAILYPQGHGDAWGHYLKSIKYYYGMMHQDNFHWYPQVEGLLVGDTEVTVSYLHEKKFAVAAAAKSRAGIDILSKTWRQEYQNSQADDWFFLSDSDTNRAWGVSEWASRVGQGTYFDWLAANSLLPDVDSDPTHEGIRVIDRVTVPELAELAENSRVIQQQLDRVDGRMNPLGLSENVVPFDISATGIDAGETHFEQVYERAKAALQNAAEIFDRVQTSSQALRDQNEERDFDQTLADEEAALNRRLIEIYGYPYSDDIGPGKAYPQGYLGPDLLHYTYVEQYAEDGYAQSSISVVSTNHVVDGYVSRDQVQIDLPLEYALLTAPFLLLAHEFEVQSPSLTQEITTNEFTVSSTGLPVKPDNYGGSRRAEGEIQLALSRYIEALNRMKGAIDVVEIGSIDAENLAERIYIDHSYERTTGIYAAEMKVAILANQLIRASLKATREEALLLADDAWRVQMAIAEAAPTAVGFSVDAGSPLRITAAATGGGIMIAKHTANVGLSVTEKVLFALDVYLQATQETVTGILNRDLRHKQQLWQLEDLVRQQQVHLSEFYEMAQGAETARMEYMKSIAKGDALLVERERLRINHAADLNAKRYRNMAYHIFRNDELNRYSETFDLAARYCYLAAKAYDYETGLLSSDSQYTAGSDFMEDIVKARTIGRMSRGIGNRPDKPLAGGPVGDPGLADILARMKANWDVLDGRLSFNNPQTETGRFSLRSELFRIKPAAAGNERSDENWRETLEKYRVDNLLALPDFQRYCLPFTPAELEEPAIVIPFSTDISFRNNFFGHDLAGGDNAYDSTHFATKIRSAGVWFSNFDNAFSGGIANQPRVYLIPVGIDRMRVPSAELDEVRSFQVVDQALPVPYPFSEQDWDDPNWSALKDMLGDELYNVRRYPSMRAYHDQGTFDATEVVNNSRLIGRSVWNTEWLLIIPGGTLLNDGDEGLDRFIHGREVYPGVRDENGVEDIKIFFQTYSFSGN